MTFRSRILVACLVVALTPLTIFALGARREVQARLSAQFGERVEASIAAIRDDLVRTARSIDARLAALPATLNDDARLRAALMRETDRAPLLDFAGRVMASSNLDYLLLLDDDGTVLSSGHFRNEFDRTLTGLAAVRAADGPVLIGARRAQSSFLALVRARSFSVGGRPLVAVAGVAVDSAFLHGLARNVDGSLAVSLDYPGGSFVAGSPAVLDNGGISEQITVPFLNDAAGDSEAGEARWTVTHSLAPLRAAQRAIDVWFIAAVGGAALLAFIIARLLAARVNRPLEELARRTRRVDLERLDVDFRTRRTDEIGTLSRTLDAMVQRLRAGAHALRAAERRATVGDLARQVNHDIRNGLLPIRNVIRHLAEVAQDSPAQLGTVFTEREGTLRSGITYLESLATNYARLSPKTEREDCDLNALIRTMLEQSAPGMDARIRLELSNASPRVTADPVALRRVVENLVTNAIESLDGTGGSVLVSTALTSAGAAGDAGATASRTPAGTATNRIVTLSVADTGPGIEPAALEHIFDDFYTTKERGTGLGLSIVRRLVADMGGRIRVDSEPGRGTTFLIELPESA